MSTPIAPTPDEIRRARVRLGETVRETPVWHWRGPRLEAAAGDVEVWTKLELWQYTGSFKPRGALCVMQSLDEETLARGVTAVSAGNHAMAVGYAARVLGTSAKVVMPENANPFRVKGCQSYGAEVVLTKDVHEAFETVNRIAREEGRTFVHPFEGPLTALGTATLGLELSDQVRGLEAVIVPIGGGGLCAGVAAAIGQLQPSCRIIGVEPEGADSMHRSFASGKPESIDAVRTIADSLGAPHAAPHSFALCRQFVHELVRVSDAELRRAMQLLFHELKLAVEPAGAATTAALCGPLRDSLQGKRVALILCGANIDLDTFSKLTGLNP